MGLALVVTILLAIGANFLISISIIIISLYEWIKEWKTRQKKKDSKPQSNNTRITFTTNNFISEQNLSRPGEITLDHHNLSNSQLIQQLGNASKDKFQSTNAVPTNGTFIYAHRLRIGLRKTVGLSSIEISLNKYPSKLTEKLTRKLESVFQQTLRNKQKKTIKMNINSRLSNNMN